MPLAPGQIRDRMEKHRAFFERFEKREFGLARRYYRGDFWSVRDGAASSETDRLARGLLCSKNLIYAVTDSAIAGLLGPNPRVGVVARNRKAQDHAAAISAFMDWFFMVNRLRRRSALALMDAVLCKRGVFKTTWLGSEDRPVIGVVDPAQLFFDLTARDQDEIRYFLEVTPLTRSQMEARVAAGLYDESVLSIATPDRYPRWLAEIGRPSGADAVRETDEWYTVVEHYDRERGVVQHYLPSEDKVLLEDELAYVPYTLFFLNHSGSDCLGVSEVQLILPQQQTVNDLLTHWKQCVYLQIPRILYDAGRLSEEDLNVAMEAATGSMVGILPSTIMSPDARFNNLFYEMPMPRAPEGVKEFVLREEADAAFISALTELARGHLAGAKTATEVAVMEAQLRTRLATREGHLHEALEDVARKGFWLASRYMQKERAVRVSGNEDWTSVDLALLRDVEVDFEAVAYNPTRTNPSILAEALGTLLPVLLQQIPPGIIDPVALIAEVVKTSGLPAKILYPEEEARKAVDAMRQAALGQGAATAPPGALPPGAPGGPGELPAGAAPAAAPPGIPPELLQLPGGAGNAPEVPPQANLLRMAAGGAG